MILFRSLYFTALATLLTSGCGGTSSPPANVPTEAELEVAIAASDDFTIHKQAFLSATSSLVSQGTCSLSELKEMGGWVKSQSHKNQPVYFTYCGGMHLSKRIYVDVSTGKVFR